jgi:hypothetical protein
MSEVLAAQIQTGITSSDQKLAERWERLRADISHYVENGLITWNFMKWLDPKKYEHWNLRSVRPRPSMRVFGRFAEPSVFIGTHTVARASLKGKWSIEWELEKLRCEEIWTRIFGLVSIDQASTAMAGVG